MRTADSAAAPRPLGIVRSIDGRRRRHRTAIGSIPDGCGHWEIGAALDQDPGDGVAVWIDALDRLSTAMYSPRATPVNLLQSLRWALAPLSWRRFDRWTRRLAASGGRIVAAVRYASRPADPVVSSLPTHAPAGWIHRSPGPDRFPLFSAVHPVTGDQLVTRDTSEARELGYGAAALLGYAVADAPMTGSLARPPSTIVWGSRFGAVLTGNDDPWRPTDALDVQGATASADSGARDGSGDPPLLFPLGHYYSPMYDINDIVRRRGAIWPSQARPMLGVDWNDPGQIDLCERVFASQCPLVFRSHPGDPTEYWSGNDQFPPLDAWVLAAVVRHLRPPMMIEVGSGFSSLVTAQVNREEFGCSMHFTCIEPYPRDFLVAGVEGISELRVELIQDAPLNIFEQLSEDDVLFIDTSHTVKTGGDVPWLFEEILPRLSPGVVVHIHDVFLPGEYPETWVMQGRGWNENYLVRAFLSYNAAFRVMWGNQYMLQSHPESLARAFPLAKLEPYAGASLWIRRVR